jgi:hypothetical protein
MDKLTKSLKFNLSKWNIICAMSLGWSFVDNPVWYFSRDWSEGQQQSLPVCGHLSGQISFPEGSRLLSDLNSPIERSDA